MSTDVILVAGSILEMETEEGIWQRVPSIKSFGAVGQQSESKEKTTIENVIKKYDSGLRDAPDKSIKGQFIPTQKTGDKYFEDYTLQQEFIRRCRNEEEFNLRVRWTGDDVNSWLFKSLGFEFDDSTQEDWRMFTVNGKQNSLVIYEVTMTEPTSSSLVVDETLQLEFTMDPVSVPASELKGEVHWTSEDEDIATVDETGLVTGVSAGDVVITVEVRGVPAKVTLTVTEAPAP